MEPSEDHASFWARIFRCATLESAEREIRAAELADVDTARVV